MGAVVTDSGGVLSHPAIIAREFRIRAVVATGNATSLLSDGQIVTVDGRKLLIPRPYYRETIAWQGFLANCDVQIQRCSRDAWCPAGAFPEGVDRRMGVLTRGARADPYCRRL
jgi:hypothetical protein